MVLELFLVEGEVDFGAFDVDFDLAHLNKRISAFNRYIDVVAFELIAFALSSCL